MVGLPMLLRINPGLARALSVIALLAACQQPPRTTPDGVNDLSGRPRLPTGAHLDPVATGWAVGSMPLAMVLAPGGDQIIVLLNGWREQGVQVLDRKTGQVLQTLPQAAAFLGLT